MALMKPKKLENGQLQPSLPAPKKAGNKGIYPINQTPPIMKPLSPFNNADSGLMSRQQQYSKDGTQPIYGTSSDSQSGVSGQQAAVAPTQQGRSPVQPGQMPPKPGPSDGQNKPVIPEAVPTTNFVPKEIDFGDYTGGKIAGPGSYDPRKESMVANQITGLLDPESALMRKAIAQSQGRAAQMGLQSSSIGAEMAQSSMIDKALPIAQQDAQTYNQAQSQQWKAESDIAMANARMAHDAQMERTKGTIQNQLQNNQLGWQGAEKATDREFQSQLQDLQYKQQLGTLDKQQELQLQQMERSAAIQAGRDNVLQGYQVELNQLQNDQRWKELTTQLGSQMDQQSRGFDQQTRLEYGNAQSAAINASMQAIGMAMQNPNMTPEQQQAAVNQIMGTLQSQADQLAVIYGSRGSGGQQPGDSTGISDPNPPLINPPKPVTPTTPPATGGGNERQPSQGDVNEKGQRYYEGGGVSGYPAGWYPKKNQ